MAITNDTRVRNISDEDVKKLQKLSKIFGINTTTGVLLKLIPEYFSNQSSIKRLETSNRKLDKELNEVQEELVNFKGAVRAFLEMEKQTANKKESLLNDLI